MRTDLSTFKSKYHVCKSPEAKYDRTPESAPWLWVIPCREAAGSGHVFTYSETHLGFMAGIERGSPYLRANLLKLLGPEALLQHGDHEYSVVFPVERLDELAPIMGCRKYKRVSTSTKKRLRALASARRKGK